MAEKGDFEKAERKLAELGIDFTAAEQKNALSGAPETEWARVDGRNSESVISITFRKVHDAIEAAAQQIKQVGAFVGNPVNSSCQKISVGLKRNVSHCSVLLNNRIGDFNNVPKGS